MSNFMEYPSFNIQLKSSVVEITYDGRTACVNRSIWPPAWNIDALDPDVARGIINWFRATAEAPRGAVTPIEIVLQMVLSYLNIEPVLSQAERHPDGDGR